MSILNNIKKVRAVIANQFVDSDVSDAGQKLNDAAMEAIFHGIGSDQWKSYMAVFADNPDQLTRLTVPGPNEETYLRQMRAYVVTSAVCDMGTNLDITGKIDSRIDGANSLKNPNVPAAMDDAGIKGLRPEGLETVRE